ncbi:MAG: prepilin-type N-terminal cleavage/methylation domain-containing protein [Phycisphaerales bacterium]|nr:prepilin-type N-terminal cleavage/methylation domain-containing protein [Phycisphaerales bacterium]
MSSRSRHKRIPKFRFPNERGFSLVELLVVLGVVMIIISLLMPAIAGAKAEARRRVCQAEMRQLAIMITTYCGESNGRFPFPLRPREDGNFESNGGAIWTPVRAVAIANYWPVAMFDDFGRSMYHESLLCPNDQFSLGDRARKAAQLGVPESEVQGTGERVLSDSLFLDGRALSQNMDRWDDRFLHVNAIHDAQFPSQKAMLIESEPLHDPDYYHVIDETGEYIATLSDPNRYHLMVAAIDGSADWRLSIDCVPGVEVPGLFRALLSELGLSDAEIDLNIQQMRRPEYLIWTRDGIRGRDW